MAGSPRPGSVRRARARPRACTSRPPRRARVHRHIRWTELERSTAADLVRAFRVIRAFAAEQAGGDAAVQSSDLLAGARPFRAGEYAWIGVRWPELARYLAARGFAAAA